MNFDMNFNMNIQVKLTLLVVILNFSSGQPTIRFTDWMTTRSEEIKFRRLQKSLDYILLELRRQTHENRQVNRQIVVLQNKISHQDEVLFNLTENVECRKDKASEPLSNEISRRLEVDITVPKILNNMKDEIQTTPATTVTTTVTTESTTSTTAVPKSYFKGQFVKYVLYISLGIHKGCFALKFGLDGLNNELK